MYVFEASGLDDAFSLEGCRSAGGSAFYRAWGNVGEKNSLGAGKHVADNLERSRILPRGAAIIAVQHRAAMGGTAKTCDSRLRVGSDECHSGLGPSGAQAV